MDDAVFVGECESAIFRGASQNMATRGDALGRKWIGTDGALYYFDDAGTSATTLDDTWERFDRTSLPARSSLLPAIAEAEGVWLVGSGLTYLHHGGTPLDRSDDVWISLMSREGFLGSEVNDIDVEGSHDIWIASDQGAAYLDHRGTRDDPCDDTLAWLDSSGAPSVDVWSVAVDSQGGKWFGAGDGLYHLNDGDTPAIAADDTWIRFDENDGLLGDDIRGLTFDSTRGGLWMATAYGATFLDVNGTPADKADDALVTFTSVDGMSSDYLTSIVPDPTGGLWLDVPGLDFLVDNQTTFDKTDDLWISWYDSADPYRQDYLIGDLWLAPDGIPWAASPWMSVRWLDDLGTRTDVADDEWHVVSFGSGSLRARADSISIDATGRKWLVHHGGGVSCFDDGATPFDPSDDQWESYAKEHGLGDFQGDVATEGAQGVWVTFLDLFADSGVTYIDHAGTPFDTSDDAWTRFGPADGLPFAYGTVIDASNAKWFAMNMDGVGYLEDGGTPLNKADDQWTYFTSADGGWNGEVQRIIIEPQGGKWLITDAGREVDYLDDNGTPSNKSDDTWVRYTTLDGLGFGYHSDIAFDAAGGKWFVGGFSLSHLDDGGTRLSKLDDQWTGFELSDGLPAGNFVSIALLPGGRLLLGGVEGELTLLDYNDTVADKTDDQWATFRAWDPIPGGNVHALVSDPAGGVWIGAEDGLGYLKLP